MPHQSLPGSARLHRLLIAGAAIVALAACSGGGQTVGLAPGLSAPINAPGAQMDRVAALSIVNHYRAVSGVGALRSDPALDQAAQELASAYARTGTPPAKPEGVAQMRLSAGYESFAETFSGWRNSPNDAGAMAEPGASRAGFAAVYNPSSAYGTHWVMLLGE